MAYYFICKCHLHNRYNVRKEFPRNDTEKKAFLFFHTFFLLINRHPRITLNSYVSASFIKGRTNLNKFNYSDCWSRCKWAFQRCTRCKLTSSPGDQGRQFWKVTDEKKKQLTELFSLHQQTMRGKRFVLVVLEFVGVLEVMANVILIIDLSIHS